MPRIVLSLAAWQAVAQELTGMHTAEAPPGLSERIQALLAQAPPGWPNQPFALELDESSAETVRLTHDALTRHDPGAAQRITSVAEADQIIHDHQQLG